MSFNLLYIAPPVNYGLIFLISTAIIVLFVLFIITTLFISQKTYYKNKKHLANLQQAFNQELLKTQIEIQEETFAYISSEIHDNIGQVLSFLKLNLSNNKAATKALILEKIDESNILIDQVILDLRNISKSLSYDNITHIGLVKTIEIEINRIKATKLFEIGFLVMGNTYLLPNNCEIVIFRIFQECVNNIIKHAKAKTIDVKLNYLYNGFEMHICDDGIGYNNNEFKGGLGLFNMKKRAKIIGANLTIETAISKGCKVFFTLKTEH